MLNIWNMAQDQPDKVSNIQYPALQLNVESVFKIKIGFLVYNEFELIKKKRA